MNEPRNPYAPPAAQVLDGDESQPTDSGRFIPYGRLLSADRGVAWIGDAWRMLKAQPAMWAAALVLMLVAYIILSLIPVVSSFLQFVAPFAYAGIALAADQQRRTGTFDLKALVGGFEKHALPLLAVGVATFVAGLIFLVVIAVVLGGDLVAMITHGFNPDPSSVMTLKFWLAILIGLALMLPVIAATYLAPQLIVLHDQPAVEAMKMSLVGTTKNILPGLVFGICAFLLLLVSMIPLLLGLIITAPILVITNYTVYRDIFVEE
jgi:uncharacterized membrane protein